MENISKNSGYGWLFFFALIGLWYYWGQTSNLQKQVAELQAQTSAYSGCVASYQANESKFTEAIQNANIDANKAKQDVDDITSYSYNSYTDTYSLSSDISRVQSDLNVDTMQTNCNIPNAPDVPTPTP